MNAQPQTVHDPTQKWQRLKAVFNEVIELSPEGRREYIASLGPDQRTLIDDLAELLTVDTAANGFLREPLVTEFGESLIGQTIGNYRVVRELGRGGMGAVFEGVREDGDFDKRVAIKLTGHNLFSDDLIRRFRNEKQILARLEHPNIVRLFDGGVTANHIPYYVMEYVEGTPITNFCRSKELSVRHRLELFGQILAAVSYAHRNLIVHRDLKPSNILVTDAGEVKLLDFGIAKNLDGEDQTRTIGTPMTPEYAAPEQIAKKSVSTASDIYSLGVLLFELLTDLRPSAIYKTGDDDLYLAVLNDEPTAPSTALRRLQQTAGDAAARSEVNAALARHLAGDLDNIVLKCLQKAPEHRYSSTDQLLADITAYLAGRPVTAHPESGTYRLKKFVLRNRYLVGASAAALLLILLGTGVAVYQSFEARKQQQLAESRFQQVRRVANALIFDYHDEIAKLEGTLSLRERLISDALTYLDAISADEITDPTLLFDLGVAYRKIGDVQGLNFNSNLGNIEGAVENYRKAVSSFARSIELDPNNSDAVSRYADASHGYAGALLNTGRRSESQQVRRETIKTMEKLYDRLNHGGVIALNRHRISEATDETSNSIRYQKLSAIVPFLDDMESRFSEPASNNTVRAVLESFRGNAARFAAFDLEDEGKIEESRHLYELSIIHYESMIALLRQVANQNVGPKTMQNGQLAYFSSIASSYAGLSDLDKAAAAIKEARALLRGLLADPNDKTARLRKLALDRVEQRIWLKQGRTADALKSIEDAKNEIAELLEDDPTNIEKVYYGLYFCQQAARLYHSETDSERIDANQNELDKYAKVIKEKFGPDAILTPYF